MPDDHSEVVPLLPIPNRTVKRLSADDSAGSRVKVGHCQATIWKALVERRGLSALRVAFVNLLMLCARYLIQVQNSQIKTLFCNIGIR